MGSWLRRLVYLLRQSPHDAELREEIEAHRLLRAAHFEREGLPSQEADAASRRAIGNVLLAREDAREVWLGTWDPWAQDVRYGLRALRKNPTFTAVAVMTLALGIGVNTGVFTVLNGLLFRDLPVPDAYQLVEISQSVQREQVRGTDGFGPFSTAQYRAYRDRATTLSGLFAVGNVRGETTLGGETPQLVLGMLVSCNYFAVLRQPPTLGREFTARDCDPGADPVVVLSHELWNNAFGADPEVVGRTIRLNHQPVTVAGVASAATSGTSLLRGGYLAPLSTGRLLAPGDDRYESDAVLWLDLMGRRREDVSVAQVRAELDLIASQIDRQQPGRSTTVAIERPKVVPPGGFRRLATGVAAVLMASFGCILLIACANVANLLLARGTARRQEIGIRVSLGASRARIVRQLLTENLLISSAGGVLGSVLAVSSFQTLVALAVPALRPPGSPLSIAWDSSPDLRVLAFALALTFATAILCGLAPALHVSTPDLHAVAKQDTAGGGTSRRGGRLRGTLVGVQVALCMALMIAAGLLIRGLHTTYTVDPGFDYRGVAYVSLESMLGGYAPDRVVALRQRLIADVAALPGVEAVAYTDREPLGDDNMSAVIRVPGQSDRQLPPAQLNTVTSDYFSLLGMPIIRGRTFTPAEVHTPAGTIRPAIISEATARNLWPGDDPIGRTLLWDETTLQVVGVAADAQVTTIGEIDQYYVYVPGGSGTLLVRSRTGFAETAASIRTAVRALDSGLVAAVLPLEATLGWWRGVSSTVTTLAGGLGVLALALASVGIYGVVSYAVARRFREIAIRLALGATTRNVLGLMLRGTMRPVVIGAAAGIALAAALSRVLASVLFGVSPADPIGLGGTTLFVLAVALATAVMAVRPVTRTDPTTVLRYE
jgi:putative ABC transport system permease protein